MSADKVDVLCNAKVPKIIFRDLENGTVEGVPHFLSFVRMCTPILRTYR